MRGWALARERPRRFEAAVPATRCPERLHRVLDPSGASPPWADVGRLWEDARPQAAEKATRTRGAGRRTPESRAKQTIATATEGTASAMSPVGEQRTFHDADEVRFDVSARFRPKAALVQTGSGNPATAAV